MLSFSRCSLSAFSSSSLEISRTAATSSRPKRPRQNAWIMVAARNWIIATLSMAAASSAILSLAAWSSTNKLRSSLRSRRGKRPRQWACNTVAAAFSSAADASQPPIQLRKAIVSLRFTRADRPRRISSLAARRSTTISSHEFHPADSRRFIRRLSPRRARSRFRTASRHRACQPTQPRDSPRCIRCRSAFDMLSRSLASAARVARPLTTACKANDASVSYAARSSASRAAASLPLSLAIASRQRIPALSQL